MGRPYGTEEWKEAEDIGARGFATERRQLVTGLPDLHIEVEAALQASEERYRYTVALSPLIPWIADAHGSMIDIDVRGLEYTGLPYEACMGSGFLTVVHPNDRPTVKRAWNDARKTGFPLDYEVRLRHRDGSYRWHRSRAAPRHERGGGIVLWYGTIEDIDDRKVADEAVRWTADHDDLTGLWNRRAFMQGLRTALAGVEGSGVEVALLLIDLDSFKALNDRYGHDVGDALLREIAKRLKRKGTGDSMAGRLGGDEFALFIYTMDGTQLDETIAGLRLALSEPCSLNGQAHSCRASIGVALYPGHSKDADSLYKNADLALYEAKVAGGGVRYFKSSMRASLQARMSELSLARQALDQKQVVPFYQPKVDLESGTIAGFEALLRWRDGRHGVHGPGTIPAAFEDAELAIALDQRIFELLAADIVRWSRLGLPMGRIAFNVSTASFRQEHFVASLMERMDRAGIPASCLELEVTETVLLEGAFHNVTTTFERLRRAGMTIALDDFGTGYASLIHLKQFPVDVLKIDRSFVQSLDDPTNAAIVRAIVNLGRDLGVTTVAEGIETGVQADRLHRNGCDQGQGYLFSPAIAADQVLALLADRSATWCRPERRGGRDRRTNAPSRQLLKDGV